MALLRFVFPLMLIFVPMSGLGIQHLVKNFSASKQIRTYTFMMIQIIHSNKLLEDLIIAYSYRFLFNCMTVSQALDSITTLT